MIHQPIKSSEPPSGFQVSSTMWQLQLFMAPKENIAMPPKEKESIQYLESVQASRFI